MTAHTNGSYSLTAAVLGQTITQPVTVQHTKHDFQKAETVAATCTQKGYDLYKCSLCDQTEKRNETALAPHSWNAGAVTKEPTCTETGVKTYTCTVCNNTKTEDLSAKGHTEVLDAAKAATCTDTGLTAGKHCSVCHAVLEQQETIPALGHNWDTKDCAVEAHCTRAGCTATRTAGEHSWNAGTVTKEPTCTEAGVKTYICTKCDATKTEDLSAKGHTPETIPAKAATCTETGLTEGSKCSVCGTVLTAQTATDALGHLWNTNDCAAEAHCTRAGCTATRTAVEHSWNDGTVTKEPTCTEAGVKTYTCTKCDATKTEDINAKGHTEVLDAAKAATCTETGLTAGKHCSVCHAVLEQQETIPALGHNWDTKDCAVEAHCTRAGCTATRTAGEHSWNAGTVTKEPTCTEAGVKTYICTKCDATKTEDLSAKGHTPETIPAKAATCTETGLTEGSKCSTCGTVLTAQTATNALGHIWDTDDCAAEAHCTRAGCTATRTAGEHSWNDTVTKQPTCTETGLKDRQCTSCGTTETNIEIPALGHAWGEAIVTAPTCTETGYTTRTCTVCTAKETYDIVDKAPHTPAVITAVPATCTDTGLTEGSKCSVCGEVIAQQEVVPALGHEYLETITKQPTCTENGEKTLVCKRGDDTKTEAIAPTGHSYGDWVVTKKPGVTSKGEETQTCANCSHQQTRELAPAGYDASLIGTEIKLINSIPSDITVSFDSYENFQKVFVLESQKLNSSVTLENMVFLDVTLRIFDNDAWHTAARDELDQYFQNGRTAHVCLPYPAGTSRDTHNYVVIHMKNDGTTESISAATTDSGLEFDVNSLSPFSIAWTVKAQNASASSSGTGTSSGSYTAPDDSVYYTCVKCGYHDWTATENGYLCSHCGYLETVKQIAGYERVTGVYEPVSTDERNAKANAATVSSPRTGDSSQLALAVTALVFSLAGIGALFFVKKKNR